jgi:hypothetical protein
LSRELAMSDHRSPPHAGRFSLDTLFSHRLFSLDILVAAAAIAFIVLVVFGVLTPIPW